MDDSKLDFWIKHNFNVLMVGKHGVGKTARVLDAFERNKLKWLYFSASTLDPWVDFIGVPKESIDANGVKYLDLIRPQAFAQDNVEAIFLDEANRAPKKVRNAMMELIQFKSINGKKFHNLKIVWAAINPEQKDEDGEELEYDVEKLDPAQKDRFHIQVEIPYKPDKTFFIKKFGEKGSTAVDWWNDLTDKVKDSVSPRRLEYVLQIHDAGGDVRDALPDSANVTKLCQELASGSFKKNLLKVFSSKNPSEMQKFITKANNFDNCIQDICENEQMMAAFFPHIDDERIAKLLDSNPRVAEFINKTISEHESQLTSALTSDPSALDNLKKKET